MALPKAVLHDHLDGSLRPQTVVDLAEEHGYRQLPTTDPDRLAAWFDQRRSGSLERYLESFRHTIALMQTTAALERVAYESIVDLAAEGVVYAETRFAPLLHTTGGLHPGDVIGAVAAGLRKAAEETGTVVGIIVDAIRTEPGSEEVARLAVAARDAGVVGFDLAGPEAGFPPDDHLAACLVAREGGLGLTIHAGEGAGPNSVWRAVARCGAARVGHGVRIVEDTVRAGGEIVALGPVAAMVRDRRIPLEVAVESNVGTGLYPDAAAHPLGALRRAGFAVTINTDNRLMSRTGMAAEFATAAAHHGFGIEELRAATEIAVLAGFAPWPERRRLLAEVIRPAYEAAGSPSSAGAGSGAPA